MEKKLEWLNERCGRDYFLRSNGDEVISFYYRAMHDYGEDLYDADRWAWLNTLFGYDIGCDHAMEINLWFYERDFDVAELSHGDKWLVERAVGELGFHLDFSGWAVEEPGSYKYF